MQKATFAAGCFWGVEHTFRQIEGVSDVIVGYTGGHTAQPDYRQVCSGRTGHAEAVEVTFDPSLVSYDQLLAVFWNSHDPTTRNRQGFDIGSQYRSAVFHHSPEQHEAAEASKRVAQQQFRREIVTEIVPASTFNPAEEYHQRYLEKHGRASCKIAAPSPLEPQLDAPEEAASEGSEHRGVLARLRDAI
ncbi:MAG: peptide-methionine (S)-S-oxide reductase MsrA [Gaiellales bacterium]